MEFRPYQEKLIDNVRRSFAKHRRIVMQCPTGGGKTACASQIIKMAVDRGKKVVFIAHLDALVEDTFARLLGQGVRATVIQAGFKTDSSADVSVCSLQTLISRGLAPKADLVVFDECHRANADRTRALLDLYPSAKILGLTATPQRSDGSPLKEAFDHMEIGPSVKTLIADGFLVPSTVISPGITLPSDEAAKTPLEAYKEFAADRRAIVFCRDLPHVSDVWASFAVSGIPCETIDGETPRNTRASIRARLITGETKVLVGCNVFTEGFDCPPIDCVIIARKIGFVGQWIQAIGRGLRPSLATKKKDCLILDLHGSVHQKGFILPDGDIVWTIDGKPKTKGLALRTCPNCQAIFEPCDVCPRCGYEFHIDEEKHAKITTSLGLHMEAVQPKIVLSDRAYVIGMAKKIQKGRPFVQALSFAKALFRKQFKREPVL